MKRWEETGQGKYEHFWKCSGATGGTSDVREEEVGNAPVGGAWNSRGSRTVWLSGSSGTSSPALTVRGVGACGSGNECRSPSGYAARLRSLRVGPNACILASRKRHSRKRTDAFRA